MSEVLNNKDPEVLATSSTQTNICIVRYFKKNNAAPVIKCDQRNIR